MRKIMLFACAVVSAGISLAAQNDALVTFSTKGPDRYADGEVVLDGERYALVFTPTGSSGAVFSADGSVEGGKIVLSAPVAKDGHCPKVVFQVSAARMASEFASGTWSVYLLDTRRYGKDGKVTLAGTAGGHPLSINAAGAVEGLSVAVASGNIADATVASGASASVATAVPEGVPTPKITAINVDGAFVYVTVENTVGFLQYDLAEGDTPGDIGDRVRNPRNGGDDGTVILVAPAKAGGAFFKVGRAE